MSRVGKVPVALPDKVEVKINGKTVSVKGPKGNLEYTFTQFVNIELKDKNVIVTPVDDTKTASALWGTTRSVINNMVTGVSAGFEKKLEFNGVGYKAAAKGSTLTLHLGYSHPIEYKIPDGITTEVNKNLITVKGCNKELVGFVSAKIRSFRPPEPYKGKGIKYSDERIIRKAGKSAKTGA